MELGEPIGTLVVEPIEEVVLAVEEEEECELPTTPSR
jgi:hypothetical protein